MNKLIVVLSLLVLLQSEGKCARILVFFCQPARSHHIVFHPILRELAQRGHNIDYYTHFPVPDPPAKLNQIVLGKKLQQTMTRFDKMNMTMINDAIVKVSWAMRNGRLKDPETNCGTSHHTQELLTTNRTYDMVIGEFFFLQEQYSTLVHKFNALGVAFSSIPDGLWVNEMAGLPDNPSYMVNFLSHDSDKLNFLDRLRNFCNSLAIKAIEYYYVMGPFQTAADEHFKYEGWDSRPPIIRSASDLALILVNSHHSLSYPYPKAPHVKEIMGSNVDENPKPLPKDLQDYMESAEYGVIYFSLGSILSIKQLRSTGKYDVLLKVFSSLNQKVLWKWTAWSGEEIPNLPNIKMVEWLPQQSILAHNKTKLFITHGGLGGVTEAVYHGVPLLGFPFFGDQFKNVKLLSESGFGIGMNLFQLTEKSLSRAIDELVNNPKYKEEAVRRSELFKDRPMKPVNEAVYWIEYVLKHGNVLQPVSARMPFYQLYLIDVFVFIIALTFVICMLVKKLVRAVLTLLNIRVMEPPRQNEIYNRGETRSAVTICEKVNG